MSIPERVVLHVCAYLAWMFVVVLVIPIGWLVLNDALWARGHGEVLVEGPIAGIHHLVMGTYQQIDNHRDAISYYEGHLRDYRDASVEARQQWTDDLARERRELRWLRVKILGGATAGYVLVAVVCEGLAARWRRRSRRTDTVVGMAV